MASPEQHGEPVPLRYIQLDLQELQLTFRGDGESSPILTYPLHPLIESVLTRLSQPHRLIAEAPTPATETDPDTSKEKTPPITLTGRVKTPPKAGHPTQSGQPTVWFKLAVHEEGNPKAHMYLASCSRGAYKVAQALSMDAQITAEGYVNPTSDPQRMDYFRAFAIHNYPGKPEKGGES